MEKQLILLLIILLSVYIIAEDIVGKKHYLDTFIQRIAPTGGIL